jgi:predicted ester cyclase
MADAATLRQNVADLLTRVLAGGETDLVARLVHPDFVNHEAAAERRHGPQGAAATSAWLRSCFGDLRYEIHHIFIDDHMTAAYVTMSGTHEGGLPPGLPATHKPFAVKHVHLIRFAEDGRTLEHSAVRDDLGMVMQLGLLPPAPPEEAPRRRSGLSMTAAMDDHQRHR